MNIIWLGHGSFRIEIADQVVLIDPWINGNPMLAENDVDAALNGTTHILVTHGHFDHTTDIVEVSNRTGAPVSGMYELVHALVAKGAQEGHAFNLGGSIALGAVRVSLVPASHSSSMQTEAGGGYMGTESGFVLQGEGRSVYISGDTAPMADMAWIAGYFKPDVGILSAGGYYTMDMALAGYAAKTYFDFRTVIPCHYRTFPALEQSAEKLVAALPGVDVIEPHVMQPIAL